MNITGLEMPVICISAVDGVDAKQKYLDAGMNEFLPKPFTEKNLLDTILSVIHAFPNTEKSEPVTPEKIEYKGTAKINLDNLYHISGGDELFVKQMLISFTESTQNGLSEMNAALIIGNSEEIAYLAHKLLPPARHIGATDLCHYLSMIEDSVKNNDNQLIIKNIIKQALSEFEGVNELILDRLDKIG